MKMSGNELKQAEILLRCEKENHDNCSVMIDALMKNFKNVLESNTTRTTIDGHDYCIAATALINDNEVKQFKNELKKLKSANNIGVRRLKMFTSTE